MKTWSTLPSLYEVCMLHASVTFEQTWENSANNNNEEEEEEGEEGEEEEIYILTHLEMRSAGCGQ